MAGPWEAYQSGPWTAFQTSKMGAADAFATGVASGVTANFSDELAGASAAGRAGVDIPKDARISMIGRALSVPVGIARLLYEQFSGDTEATGAYEKRRDEVRAQQAAAEIGRAHV